MLEEIESKIRSIILDVTRECDADSISLSGGLDSSILASCLKVKTVKAFVAVAKDFPSTDLIYAQLVAHAAGLKLDLVSVGIDELLHSAEETIKILKIFNPIEIRNTVVAYIVMNAAKKSGCDSIITGDGADELFAGYNFFKKLPKDELDRNLARIWKTMHFPSRSIAKSIGISLYTPFLDARVLNYAKQISSDWKIREENGKKYGKWILRKSFENRLPSSIVWREKSAMQDGSGTNGLTGFLSNMISDSTFNEKVQSYIDKDKVNLASKESLYYYEIYKKYFDKPISLSESGTRCPNCNFALVVDSHFCRMCGSYPI